MKETTELLTAAQILECSDLEEEVVEVPEWGGSVRVRSFSKALQQQIRKDAKIAGEIDSDRLELLLFISGVVEPKFSPDQYEQLRKKNAKALDRVLKVLNRLSGLGEEALEEAKTNFPEES